VQGYGEVSPPFWERLPGGPSITDGLSSARARAVEELQCHSGSVGCNTTWSPPVTEAFTSQASAPSVPTQVTPVFEEQLENVHGRPEASEPPQTELLAGIVGMSLLVSLFGVSLVASPVVWWLYGPVWAICTAVAAVVLFAVTPFRDLIAAILLVNFVWCVLAAEYLVFFPG